MSSDEPAAWLARALAQAAEALGTTRPNPAVGAVLVRAGQVVGEGHTQPVGLAHAEVQAIAAAGAAARGASLYVTLEPCNHHGRTPPCTEAIIAAGIAEVHYPIRDQNPVTAGQAAEKLRSAGIRVIEGEGRAAAERFYRPFFKWITTGRPYVIAKFAASLDGRIATRGGESKWITSAAARARAQQLRRVVDAIVVGVDTVIADDPRLTVRGAAAGDRARCQPWRVVLDSSGRTPLASSLFDQPGETLIAGTRSLSATAETALRRRGAEVIRLPERDDRVDLAALLDELGRREMTCLMIEGGAATLGSFFDHRLVDEVWAFLAPLIIGGRAAPGAVGGWGPEKLVDAGRLTEVLVEMVGPDLLVRGQVIPAGDRAE